MSHEHPVIDGQISSKQALESHASTLYDAQWHWHYAPKKACGAGLRRLCEASIFTCLFKTCSRPFPQKPALNMIIAVHKLFPPQYGEIYFIVFEFTRMTNPHYLLFLLNIWCFRWFLNRFVFLPAASRVGMVQSYLSTAVLGDLLWTLDAERILCMECSPHTRCSVDLIESLKSIKSIRCQHPTTSTYNIQTIKDLRKRNWTNYYL